MNTANDHTTYLPHHFLIAMPEKATSQFIDALTYICDHTEEGAMGIVINYPLDLTLENMLKQMNIDSDDTVDCSQPVYYGGPIQCERGFVLHRPQGQWYASLSLTHDLSITTSRDILEAMAKGKGPPDSIVFLGYCGWEAGQLETEMADNIWLSSPADLAVLFKTPYHQRRSAAANLLGVNLSTLSRNAGHA